MNKPAISTKQGLLRNSVGKLLMAIAGTVVSAFAVMDCAQAATVFSYKGNQYFLTDTPATWTGAQSQAVAQGGNLVAIDDADEQNWLLATFAPLIRNAPLWIGLTDVAQEGVFQWVNGQPLAYTNWASGEPNNMLYTPAGEDYVALYPSWGGAWNDLPNDGPGFSPTYGIIESTPVPTPALLPGLVGMGVAALRKRKGARSEAAEQA